MPKGSGLPVAVRARLPSAHSRATSVHSAGTSQVRTSALLKASNALAVRNPDSPEEVELSEEALAKMTMSEVEELIDEKREELIGQAAMTEAILTKLDGTEENAAEAIEIATKKLSGVLQAGSNKLVEDAQARVVAANESLFETRASHDVFVRDMSRVEREASGLLQLQHDQIAERRLLHHEDRKIYREYYRAMTRTEDIASCFIQQQHDRFVEYAIQMGRTEKEASCLLQEQHSQLHENAIEMSRIEQAFRDQLQHGQDEFHEYAAEMGKTEREASCLLQKQHHEIGRLKKQLSDMQEESNSQMGTLRSERDTYKERIRVLTPLLLETGSGETTVSMHEQVVAMRQERDAALAERAKIAEQRDAYQTALEKVVPFLEKLNAERTNPAQKRKL
ncbi:unnamed protein product [Zymoseptoria tritici ST99CH_3D7]|uniref:Uncharacterized protein n=1 Tax=Zymoseptoria tritici (strain ST99CH_3D7) TaxID=1276538 RepID=A0A1X7S4J8_ZYMT9|nr:unnamed protein product [Zymoseptoria tritici ST99CH_3D7]